MNDDHDDAQLDAAIEALARQEPPADHVARVLARTGPDAAMAGSASRPYQRSRPSRLIWALPVAATVLVALGVTWQVGRMSEGALERVEMARSRATSGVEGASRPYQPQVWGAPRETDLPVLPPQAYWGMDAFEEWKSLPPGATLGSRESGVRSRESGVGNRTPGTGEAAAVLAWVPVPSGLPPIELESIAPAPIEIAPLAALEPITVDEIPLAPIVIAPVDAQEKP
jgi:hypothetical protein